MNVATRRRLERDVMRVLDAVTGRAMSGTSRSATPRWAGESSVRGFGIGAKTCDGAVTDELAIKVYVDRKRDSAELVAPVPPAVRVLGTRRHVLTDVEAVGNMRPQSNTDRVRPAEPGYSIGPEGVFGTFGCVVEELAHPGIRCLLSNFHVLTAAGVLPRNAPIYQPSPLDQPSTGNEIATLRRWVGIQYETAGFPNKVDAAIARVIDPAAITTAIHELRTPVGVKTTPWRDMPVQIVGRTSGHQTGVAVDVDCRMVVPYPLPGGGTTPVGFSDQVLCSRYSKVGDSGSVVLDMDDNIVGLHFYGSDTYSLFNKIENVIAELQIWVVTS